MMHALAAWWRVLGGSSAEADACESETFIAGAL
jgi:hypothetical protein